MNESMLMPALLEVRGASHFSFNNGFTDAAIARRLCGTEEQFATIRRFSISFLERHVAGRPNGGLDEADPGLTRRESATGGR